MHNTTTSPTTRTLHKVRKTIRKRSFATIATSSTNGHGHSAGIVYTWVDGELWMHTSRSSRKGRNIAGNNRIGVCIPFRRLPVGPPYTIHFQASATLVALDDPAAVALIDTGRLTGITSHGELDMANSCFVRIRPTGTMHSFGPGAKIIDLIRDPLGSGARSFDLAEVL